MYIAAPGKDRKVRGLETGGPVIYPSNFSNFSIVVQKWRKNAL